MDSPLYTRLTNVTWEAGPMAYGQHVIGSPLYTQLYNVTWEVEPMAYGQYVQC